MKINEILDKTELLAQLAEEASELAQAALKLRRAIDGKNPTSRSIAECEAALDEEIAEYTVYNNPILLFLKETDEDEILNQETKLVHSKYEMFCSDNGFQSVGLSTFSKEITRQLDCRVINKRIDKARKGRVFVK